MSYLGRTIPLHVTVWEEGERVLMVHGSFGWGEGTFVQQLPLAIKYQLLVVDRDGRRLFPPSEKLHRQLTLVLAGDERLAAAFVKRFPIRSVLSLTPPVVLFMVRPRARHANSDNRGGHEFIIAGVIRVASGDTAQGLKRLAPQIIIGVRQ